MPDNQEPFAKGLRTTYYLEANPPSSEDILNEGPVCVVQVLRIPLQTDEILCLSTFLWRVQMSPEQCAYASQGQIILSYNPRERVDQIVITRANRRMPMARETALRLREALTPYLPETMKTVTQPEEGAEA